MFMIVLSTLRLLCVDDGFLLRDWLVLEEVELLHYALGLGRRFPGHWQR
jgi:hypothetical protein